MNSKNNIYINLFFKGQKKEFEDIFKINVARTLSSNFYHRKMITKISADRALSVRSASWVLKG